MSDARAMWIRSRDRKRAAVSWSLALALYALAFAGALIAGLFKVEDLGDYSGPVVVRLGKPEGLDVPAGDQVPLEAPQESPPVTTEAQPATPAVSAPVAPTAAAPTPAVPAVPQKPVAPAPTVPAKPAAPQPVIIKGSESGNSYDIMLDGSAGTVSRGMYVPIWVYMPLPMEIYDADYRAIPDYAGLPGTAIQRKASFAEIYEKNAIGIWRLKRLSQPALDLRPDIWTMLEDAGYDVGNADFKERSNLDAITILFKVSAYSAKAGVVLEDIHVESSSNYSDIDEAVLYAFKKAGFTNSGDKSINGRFTYRFD